MVDNATKDMLSFADATRKITSDTTKLYDVTKKLRYSSYWTILSRFTSGTGAFWELQNTLRGIIHVANEITKKTVPSMKQLQLAVKGATEAMEASQRLEPIKGIFDKDALKDVDNISNLIFLLEENLSEFKGTEFSLFGKDGIQTIEDEIEMIQAVKEIFRELHQQTTTEQKAIDKRTNRKRQLQDELRERQAAGSSIGTTGSRFDNIRVKLLQKQLIASEYVGQIKKVFKIQTWLNFGKFIKTGLVFFAKFMLGLAAILVGLVLLKNVFEGFKEPFATTMEWLGEIFEVAMTIIAYTMGIISNGIADIKYALENGDIILLLWGLLQVFGGVVLLALTAIGTAITVVIGGTLKLIWERLKDGFLSLKGFATMVLDVVQLVAVVVGIMALLGSTLISLPVLIIAAIAGVVAAVVKKMVGLSTGGIVNSNMQLVGEKGPELVSLPRGSRVHSNADSQRMGSSGGNTIHIHVSGRVGASDAEIRDIANKIGKEIKLKMMRSNNGVSFF